MIVREIERSDCQNLIALFKALDRETEFMLYEPGERDFSKSNQDSIINSFLNSPSKTMLISENSKELTGFIAGVGGKTQRTKHALYIAVGIKQAFTGQNLGATFFEIIEGWAKKNEFHRLELTVMEHNKRAIKLYKSLGFIEEGIKHHSIKLNSGFINELSMYKLI